MRKLTNPWRHESDPEIRAIYAEEARERLADLATRPIAAVHVRSSESYMFYRVLGITADGRHVGIATDLAGAAHDGKRVNLRGGDIVEGPHGWFVRVPRDGTRGAQHIQYMLCGVLGTAPYDVREF